MAAPKKPGKPESDSLLTRIDSQIAALQAFRAAYIQMLTMGINLAETEPLFPNVGGIHPAVPRTPIELPVGAFRDKSIPDAIKLFLSAAREKKTIREIAEGLKAGGLETRAKYFETTVTGSLHRLRATGVVLQFPGGKWDLAEAYPEHIRKSVAADAKPPRQRKPRGSRKRTGNKQKALPEPKGASIRGVIAHGPARATDGGDATAKAS
jgi:hypothetical protein